MIFKSFDIDSNCLLSIFSDSCSNSNQYIVSSASFKAMLNLFIKSALLCALRLSAMFAPMLVPER